MHFDYRIGVSADLVRGIRELADDRTEGGWREAIDVLGDEVVRLGSRGYKSKIAWDCELCQENVRLIWLRVECSMRPW